MENIKDLQLHQIAVLIKKDWQKVYFGAKPYLQAMHELNSVNDRIMFSSGKEVVLYFLTNATTWRGDTAKAVKAELKRRCK